MKHHGFPSGDDPWTSPMSPSSMATTSQPTIFDGINDDISMISTDKIYLLTHTPSRSVNSLQVYDADEFPTDEASLAGSSAGSSSSATRENGLNREMLDVFEEVKFGFGIVFRLAGLCEGVKLVYHEVFLVGGSQYAAYTEVMGTFGRLNHVEKAYYYCPRETYFGPGCRQLLRPELEISIRTEAGVELFCHRWNLAIRLRREMASVELGDAAVQVETCQNSVQPKATGSRSNPSLHSGASSSRDSLALDSFVDVEDSFDSTDASASRTSQGSVPMPRQPNVLQQVGMWLYGSRLGQYVARNIDPSNQRVPKETFMPEPIWLLGIRYEMKNTDLAGFKASSLIPSRSENTLSFSRHCYQSKAFLMRKEVHNCKSNHSATILEALVGWAQQYGCYIISRTKFSITLGFGESTLGFNIFSFTGLVLETTLSSSNMSDLKFASFYAETLKALEMKFHLLEPTPIVKECSGLILPFPTSDVSFCKYPWNLAVGPLPSIDGELALWDPSQMEWIICYFSLSVYGHFLLLSKSQLFLALNVTLGNINVSMDNSMIKLISNDGREYFCYIQDIQARSSLYSRMYVLSAKVTIGLKSYRSAAATFRKTFELNRVQTALERNIEVQRRYSLNTNIIQDFLLDFSSRFWFSYRRDMSRIGNTIINTDAGWGCLVRCGQMMIAETFARILLGRGWNFVQLDCGGISPQLYQSILAMFEDKIAPTSPFGLHALVTAGAAFGHPIGQWFSPTLLALVLSEQSRKTRPMHFMVLPIEHGVLSISLLRSLVSVQPLLLLATFRLGIETFNTIYVDLVTGSLELPQSVGIIGGKPGKCFHIVGHQEKRELYYLDPHITRGPPPNFPTCMKNREFHTTEVLAMNPSSLDPSLIFGYLVRDPTDLDRLIAQLTRLNLSSPVFSFMP